MKKKAWTKDIGLCYNQQKYSYMCSCTKMYSEMGERKESYEFNISEHKRRRERTDCISGNLKRIG